MRPAPSIIVFTVTSGLGLGLFAMTALVQLAGLTPLAGHALPVVAAFGFATVTIGLVSSTFHLANKRNAWRALARVRTSWLSREAVLALGFYPVTAAWLLIATDTGSGGGALAFASAVLALGTVFTTGMIYACLRTVRQWYTPLTPLVYLAAALALGVLALHAIVLGSDSVPNGLGTVSVVLIALALAIKLAWYQHAGTPARLDPARATGLGPEEVRLLESGHSAGTYLTREFLYELGARRARVLRVVALGLGYVAPLALVAGAPHSFALALAALASAYTGMLVERWLFFAEATHVVRLYHGAASA